jgi:hypothetical protein
VTTYPKSEKRPAALRFSEEVSAGILTLDPAEPDAQNGSAVILKRNGTAFVQSSKVSVRTGLYRKSEAARPRSSGQPPLHRLTVAAFALI